MVKKLYCILVTFDKRSYMIHVVFGATSARDSPDHNLSRSDVRPKCPSQELRKCKT